MRADEYSWVWEADQDGYARAREWEARQLGRLYHLPPQPCPSTLCSLPWVSFLICVFPHLRSLCPSSYTSTRWPVRIKIKALRASSCQTICVLLLHLVSLICITWENLPGTLQEFTPEKRWKGLENRGHHVH